MNTIEGKLSAKGLKFALVASRFNDLITKELLSGAVDCIVRHEGSDKDVTVAWCPGSFEIPLVAQKLANTKNYDAIICLGAVIRGDTPHFDYVAAEVTKGIASVGLNTGVPVVFGVLTTNSIEQALERAGTKAGNKGWDAALSAIESVNLLKQIK